MSGDWVNWFPFVFFPVKILVLGVGMYYSIKWHHDQDKAKKARDEASQASAPVEQTLGASD